MTGLFPGSFNPIHNGHIAIAHSIIEQGLCNTIWFVPSPHNPFKKENDLLEEQLRLEIVEKALELYPRLKVCDLEFSLPKPSYTINTLHKLKELYPQEEFSLIIGEDNLCDFHLWHNYQEILSNYKIYVYPRPDITCHPVTHPNILHIQAPLMNISSTEIRQKIRQHEDIYPFVPSTALPLILKYYNNSCKKF